jgi:hypothetical protein
MLSQKIHRHIFLFGVCSLAFGMMIGTVPTSVPQFILLGNWLLEGDFKRKWQQVKHNKIFWVLSSVFLIHVAGLMYTLDLKAGWDDVRTKMPLMFLPLIFFTNSPLSKKELTAVFYFFIAGCVANISWCFIYSFALHKNEVIRSASRFMSHIRLGLYLNVAIAVCVWFIKSSDRFSIRVVHGLFILLFLFSMYALGLFSGFLNFIILLFFFVCYLILRLRFMWKVILSTILLMIIFSMFYFISSDYRAQMAINKIPYNEPKNYSKNGRSYVHLDSLGLQKENGNIVMINIQWDELKNEWNKRCPEDSFSYHPAHNLQRYEILLRYLTSKQLGKDSLGISMLTENDIINVKKNITNYKITEWSFLRRRLYESIYEYEEVRHRKDINGHSLTMRPYFWKAALHVIQKNLLTGIGTGDVQEQLNKAYKETNSPLSAEWYKRPHNQFITVTVATGIIGLCVFLWSLILPLIRLRKFLHFVYAAFIILAISSFLLEDTLESQAGLTFFAFFNSLFVVQAWHQKRVEPDTARGID